MAKVRPASTEVTQQFQNPSSIPGAEPAVGPGIHLPLLPATPWPGISPSAPNAATGLRKIIRAAARSRPSLPQRRAAPTAAGAAPEPLSPAPIRRRRPRLIRPLQDGSRHGPEDYQPRGSGLSGGDPGGLLAGALHARERAALGDGLRGQVLGLATAGAPGGGHGPPGP